MSRAAEIAKKIVAPFLRTVGGESGPRVEKELTEALREFWHAAFLEALPAHESGLSIEHNPHKSFGRTVVEYVSGIDRLDDFVSDEERERAFAVGELWEMHWYDGTRLASSLEALLR